MSAPKKFGLIVKQKEEPKKIAPVRVTNVFGDNDDDDDMPATATNASSASVIRIQKAAEREHQKAEAEDPTIFDYDGNYDEIQAIKNEKKEEARKADKNKESKYAEAIIKAHARRQLEQFSREERQQIKEREKEQGEFDDKEVFVTGAYRKQQEMVKEFREKEAEEAAFNDMTSVQKQKMWEMGMGRTLLNDLARDPTAIRQRKAVEASKKNLRKRDEDSDDEKAPEEEVKKKSIYDTDSEEEDQKTKKKEEPKPKKNFDGELKAGLNLVTKKATTRAERVQRNFTPTPPSSDDEGAGARPAPRAVGDHRSSRRSSSPRRSRDTGTRRSKSPEESREKVEKEKKPKVSLKDKLKPKKIDKQARLDGLKAILAQRNTAEDIEAARQRYYERRDQGIVVPPL